MSDVKKILIIDDEKELAELVKDYLALQNQYSILLSSDPFAAQALCDHQKFDLIITDYLLPKLDGVQLIKKIRLNLKNSRTPIIIMSGNSDEALVRSSHLANVCVIQKPFTLDEILKLSNEMFNLPKAA